MILTASAPWVYEMKFNGGAITPSIAAHESRLQTRLTGAYLPDGSPNTTAATS